jgi:hypothetical protein
MPGVVVRSMVIGLVALGSGALSGGAGLGACRHHDPDEALSFTDRYAILDSTVAGGCRYVLVHVFTTVPDFMQRVDLYRYEDVSPEREPQRSDFRRSRNVLGADLDDNFRSLPGGAYTVREVRKGAIDLAKRILTVEFDTGPRQVIPLPEQATRGECRRSVGGKR